MLAKKQAKIFSRGRVPLEGVIPLETPFSVEIDVCSVCNFSCNFCFHADKREIRESGVRFGRMELPLFRKILGDLKRFPEKIKKVRLFEFGEPLLHPDLPEMIRAIWEADVAEYVEITSNGVLLTPELNLKLVAPGLSRINISVDGVTEEKYREVAGYPLKMEAFLANLRHLYEHRGSCHIYIKLADDGTLTKGEEERFYALFGDLCDEIFIERLSPIWRDTEINSAMASAVGPYGQTLEYKTVCPLIFTRMVINYDGVVVACCVDWKRQYVIGDLSRQSAYDIWNGELLRELQLRHLRGERESIGLCRGCTALSSCTIDNVDAHAGELLGNMEAKRGERR
jgi:radical SAM protein with 4Fe4S-binding SPASM domain